MPISLKQQKILAFPYTRNYQALICDGAVRSGKTSIMTVAFVDWAMREFNNTNFAICGKTVGSAIKNIITPYMALTYHRDKYKITFTRSDNKMVVRAGKRVNTFYVYGGKDESSYMLIQGITLAGVLLDEVALMTRSFVEEALARCLTFPNRRYWFNCNPDSPMHWFYREWILQPEKHKALHLHFLMTDNPALDAETIRQAERDFSGVFYERKVLGRWVKAEGVIYRAFSDDPEAFRIEKVPPLDKIIIGVDWGGNKSGHSFTASGITRGFGGLIALCSEKHTATGTTPEDLYRLYREFEKTVRTKYGEPDAVYPDNAEQVLLNGLREHTSVPVYDSYKCPIVDRIRKLQQLMGQGRFAMTGDCKSLESALCDAVWDEKKLDDARLDDGTSDIDSLDSFEYSWSWYIDYL